MGLKELTGAKVVFLGCRTGSFPLFRATLEEYATGGSSVQRVNKPAASLDLANLGVADTFQFLSLIECLQKERQFRWRKPRADIPVSIIKEA